MRPQVRIHAVLGPGSEREVPDSGELSILRLPGGTTATRWLSRGASRPKGLAASAERLLNAGAEVSTHCVLDLVDPKLDALALTDELDPRWPRGLPRVSSLLGDVLVQLAELGAKGVFGTLVLDFPGEIETQRVRKVGSWCRQQDLRLALRGSTSEDSSLWLPRLPPDSTARELADLLKDPD